MDEPIYMKVEEEAVEMIRETARNTIEFNRRRHRDEEADLRRPLTMIRSKMEPFEDIVKRLKSKSVTDKELSALKNAMIQDSHNIGMVLKEHGALQGLVREITGHNAEKQYQAIGCICNLAMGNSKARATVTKHTGPYVILLLDNHNIELKKVASWTLTNLAGCPKACDRLVAQGAISKLADVVCGPHDMEVKEPAIQALIQITRQLKTLRQEHMKKIQEALIQADCTTETLELMFILSCSEHFSIQTLPVSTIEHYFNTLLTSLESYPKGNTKTLTYLLRIFANSLHVETYENLLQLFLKHKNVVKQILDSDLNETMFWLIGNMWRQCSDKVLEVLE